MQDIPYSVISTSFNSKNTLCRGDLYLPEGVEKPPVIIMAHGLAAERNFGLSPYASRFATNGLAVLSFDYRCFGDSDGTPRNLVNPFRHIADWESAVAHVKTLDSVDGERIGLWGSSFSGGHVIVTAARNPSIAAISAQVPFVDSFSTVAKLGPKFLFQSTIQGTRDILRILTFRPPYYIKVIGKPDEFAAMNTPESYPGYSALIPEGSGWENKCPARILLTFAAYRPIASAKNVKCPALIILAENDSLISAKAVEKTARAMENSELIKYPVGHFDLYSGDYFEDIVTRQTVFFHRYL